MVARIDGSFMSSHLAKVTGHFYDGFRQYSDVLQGVMKELMDETIQGIAGSSAGDTHAHVSELRNLLADTIKDRTILDDKAYEAWVKKVFDYNVNLGWLVKDMGGTLNRRLTFLRWVGTMLGCKHAASTTIQQLIQRVCQKIHPSADVKEVSGILEELQNKYDEGAKDLKKLDDDQGDKDFVKKMKKKIKGAKRALEAVVKDKDLSAKEKTYLENYGAIITRKCVAAGSAQKQLLELQFGEGHPKTKTPQTYHVGEGHLKNDSVEMNVVLKQMGTTTTIPPTTNTTTTTTATTTASTITPTTITPLAPTSASATTTTTTTTTITSCELSTEKMDALRILDNMKEVGSGRPKSADSIEPVCRITILQRSPKNLQIPQLLYGMTSFIDAWSNKYANTAADEEALANTCDKLLAKTSRSLLCAFFKFKKLSAVKEKAEELEDDATEAMDAEESTYQQLLQQPEHYSNFTRFYREVLRPMAGTMYSPLVHQMFKADKLLVRRERVRTKGTKFIISALRSVEVKLQWYVVDSKNIKQQVKALGDSAKRTTLCEGDSGINETVQKYPKTSSSYYGNVLEVSLKTEDYKLMVKISEGEDFQDAAGLVTSNLFCNPINANGFELIVPNDMVFNESGLRWYVQDKDGRKVSTESMWKRLHSEYHEKTKLEYDPVIGSMDGDGDVDGEEGTTTRESGMNDNMEDDDMEDDNMEDDMQDDEDHPPNVLVTQVKDVVGGVVNAGAYKTGLFVELKEGEQLFVWSAVQKRYENSDTLLSKSFLPGQLLNGASDYMARLVIP